MMEFCKFSGNIPYSNARGREMFMYDEPENWKIGPEKAQILSKMLTEKNKEAR